MSGYTDGTLIPLATPDGQALLAAATDAGTCTYSRLAPYWAPQVHRRRCGLRSAAVVLNTLAEAEVFAEDGWFDAAAVAGNTGGAAAGNATNDGVGMSGTDSDAGEPPPPPLPPPSPPPPSPPVRPPLPLAVAAAATAGVTAEAVDAQGMTLAQLGALLSATITTVGIPPPPPPPRGPRSPFPAPLTVTVTYADADTDGWGGWPAALRNAACDAAALLVNYEMRVAGQGDALGGHISPVAAWHPPTDRLLIMDVWPATGPVWVPTGVLAAAAATADKGSGRSRGCVALTLGGRG